MNPHAVSVLIPAAGASKRLGQAKQLVGYKGKPLLEQVIHVASCVAPLEIIVVTGAHAQRIRDEVSHPGVRWVHNPHWAKGMGGSIALAASVVDPKSAGVMILLCDQYCVTADDLLELLGTWHADPGKIAAAESGGRCSPPVIFPATLLGELASLSGEAGARSLLKDRRKQVMAVPMENAAHDLDTPAQLGNL